MLDQYFGIKEMYQLVLKAKTPMAFGTRQIEAGEPVLYFEDINMALLSEQNRTITAHGGWANMPRVIWSDRSDMTFQLSEGVMSSIEMSVLLGANMGTERRDKTIKIFSKEGPFSLANENLHRKMDQGQELIYFYIKHEPILDRDNKIFIFQHARKVPQIKVYGSLDKNTQRIYVYKDKELTIPGDTDKEYIVDYYYKYGDEALIYTIAKERFNGLFTLEGKFYSKDENEGKNYTNLIYMPKVRVVSDISLRLGERADPTVSTFNIIGLPETVGDQQNLIAEITRLSSDVDEEI